MSESPITIRASTAADLPAITAVYGWNVLHGTGSDRVVEADALDEAAVATQARIGDDDVEERALLGTPA